MRQFLTRLWAHKGKLPLLVVFVILWLLYLFPLSELSSGIGAQVAKLSQQQVQMSFQNLSLRLVPSPGIALENPKFQISQFGSPLQMQQLVVHPSLSSLWSKTPRGQILAEGLWGGKLQLNMSAGSSTATGLARQRINFVANDIDLVPLMSFTGSAHRSVKFMGKLSRAEGSAQLEESLRDPPEANVQLQISQFQLLPSVVETLMGPLSLPPLKISDIQGRLRLQEGQLYLEDITLGKPGDDIQGSVKGSLAVVFTPGALSLGPSLGSYTVDLDLRVSKALEEKAALFLAFLSSYRSVAAGGLTQYRLRMTGAGPQSTPSLSPIR